MKQPYKRKFVRKSGVKILSNYFIENNWDIKNLIRLMVNSHTYMQCMDAIPLSLTKSFPSFTLTEIGRLARLRKSYSWF